jgi:hypothetical protein
MADKNLSCVAQPVDYENGDSQPPAPDAAALADSYTAHHLTENQQVLATES